MKKPKHLLPLILIICFAIAIGTVGTVFAFMYHKTEPVVNNFEKAEVQCEVIETFNGTTKSSIKIKNTGNIDAYLRLRFISYWVDSSGNIVGRASVMPTVNYDTANWLYDSANQTYYYKGKVGASNQTPELLKEPITLIEDTDTNEKQTLVIIAEAVQADPSKAVTEMWQFIDSVGSDGNLAHTTS